MLPPLLNKYNETRRFTLASLGFLLQDSLGNYDDCCLTLREAKVWPELHTQLDGCALVQRDVQSSVPSPACCCCQPATLATPRITLQDPVVTPDGCLYSKEAILENLLAQKKAIKRNLEAWEAAQQQQKQKVRVEAGTGGCRG